jgi:hypothetical protein
MSRLLDQVREAVRTRHYSIRTEEAYIRWTRQYILFCGKRHPSELGAADVSAFISHLAVRRKVAPPPRLRRSLRSHEATSQPLIHRPPGLLRAMALIRLS